MHRYAFASGWSPWKGRTHKNHDADPDSDPPTRPPAPTGGGFRFASYCSAWEALLAVLYAYSQGSSAATLGPVRLRVHCSVWWSCQSSKRNNVRGTMHACSAVPQQWSYRETRRYEHTAAMQLDAPHRTRP